MSLHGVRTVGIGGTPLGERQCLVSVVGKGLDCPTEVQELAHEVGRAVARSHAILLTGGLGGAMAAATLGAVLAEGMVVAVTPDQLPSQVPATLTIRTGLAHTSRNIVMGTACDLMLALNGGPGTMQEIAVASERGIPMAQVGTDRWPGLDVLTIEEVPEWLNQNIPRPLWDGQRSRSSPEPSQPTSGS